VAIASICVWTLIDVLPGSLLRYLPRAALSSRNQCTVLSNRVWVSLGLQRRWLLRAHAFSSLLWLRWYDRFARTDSSTQVASSPRVTCEYWNQPRAHVLAQPAPMAIGHQHEHVGVCQCRQLSCLLDETISPLPESERTFASVGDEAGVPLTMPRGMRCEGGAPAVLSPDAG
jgi:hypothetical protein